MEKKLCFEYFFYNYAKKNFIYNFIQEISLFTICLVFSYQLLQCQPQNFCSCRPPQRSLFQAPRSKSPTWTQPNIFTYVSRMEPLQECSGKPLYDQKPMSTTSVILLIQYPYLICVSFSSVLLKNHSKGRSLLSISVLVLTQSASMCSS